MGVYSYGARLSLADVVDLDAASTRLATAVGAIRRANPIWGDAVVQLIYEANEVVVRVQNKGALSFARYLEKHGLKEPQDAPGIPAAGELLGQEPIARPGPEEK